MKNTMRNKSEKLAAIEWVVMRAPDGLYGKEICALTGLSYWLIYERLAELENAGRIERREEIVADGTGRLPRHQFFAKAHRAGSE